MSWQSQQRSETVQLNSAGHLGAMDLIAPPAEEESDQILAIKAREDRTAFGVLYERYLRRIYSYHYYRCGNVADAEELTARTFYRALANIHRYSDQGVPFSAWLFRVAHNLLVNWHRDNGRHPISPLDAEVHAHYLVGDPMESVEKTEEIRQIRQMVSRLPVERQQMIALKFAGRLTNAEVAEVMGRTEGAIKALLHRTISKLRKELNKLDQTRTQAGE